MTTLTKAEEEAILRTASLIQMDEASKDFRYFLDFVYINEAPQAGAVSSGGKTKVSNWPHLIELDNQLMRPWELKAQGLPVLEKDRKTAIGKARQVGFSERVAAWNCWLIFFKRDSVSLMTSRGEKEAIYLLKKVKDIYDNLPDLWKQTQTPKGRSDSSTELVLYDMNSRIFALPSTEHAGRGFTFTCVTTDEFDFHEYGGSNMMAVLPSIDGGGQLIQGSTVDKRRISSPFQNTLRNFDELGYTLLVWPYDVRPGREGEWYEKKRLTTPEEELNGLSREMFMEQEYPRSLEEMLSPPKASSYFDFESLMRMQRYSHDPIQEEGVIKVYNKFNGSHKYVAGTDVAGGRGGDADSSVTLIIDVTEPMPYKVVAEIITNTLDIDAFANASLKMLDMFDNPWWNIENNGLGEGFALRADDLYPHRRLFYGEGKVLPGLSVTRTNRPNIWNELRGPIRRGELVTPSIRGLQDLFDIMVNTGKDGNLERPEARRGAHDDYASALAVAWYIKDKAATQRQRVIASPVTH